MECAGLTGRACISEGGDWMVICFPRRPGLHLALDIHITTSIVRCGGGVISGVWLNILIRRGVMEAVLCFLYSMVVVEKDIIGCIGCIGR